MNAVEANPSAASVIRSHRFTAHLYLVLAFTSYLILSFSFERIYLPLFSFGREVLIVPYVLNVAWCFILTGIVWLLPPVLKKIFMLLTAAFYNLLVIADGVMFNMFNRFFSFSDFSFAGDGAEFLDSSYLQLPKPTLAVCIMCFTLMLLAVILSPRRKTGHGWKPLVFGTVLIAVGFVMAFNIKDQYLQVDDVVVWNETESLSNPADIYDDYSDTKQATLISGIYEYSFRSLYKTLGIFDGFSVEELVQAEKYISSRPEHVKNSMTGTFEGKNIIVIQLEAIDTWMLSEKYMPNLYGIKQDSIQFANHFTPAYITAGTFNTEFMANTGLFPAATGTPSSVYSKNSYPYALPSLFESAGYSANSFHNSEGDVYNRENIHPALGYESYHGGSSMHMQDYTLDSQLINGYEEMTKADKFCSFIITISGHGPYNGYSAASNLHIGAASAVAERSEENYVHAVAHAMETDIFIGELYDRLNADGLLDNTVLVFYADHYNYYMLDDELSMEIKGAPCFNMLAHTDFFIYSKGTQPLSVSKVTSSVDITPTVANLFGFDIDYRNYIGSDAFSDEGGYVFFPDGSWYDGETYWDSSSPVDDYAKAVNKDIALRQDVCQTILRADYYADRKG